MSYFYEGDDVYLSVDANKRFMVQCIKNSKMRTHPPHTPGKKKFLKTTSLKVEVDPCC